MWKQQQELQLFGIVCGGSEVRITNFNSGIMYLGFYAVMASASLGRMVKLRQFDPLPLRYIPFFAVPFWLAYLGRLYQYVMVYYLLVTR